MRYVYKVGVLGAGQMGAGIAQAVSFAGIPVVMRDVTPKLLDRGMEQIRSVYDARVKKGKMTQEEMQSKVQLVTPTTDLANFSDCDLIIEAIPEDIGVKMKAFSEISGFVSDTCLVCSNTSSLSISKMATAYRIPGNFLGLHFFFPANVMKLVEIISGLQTSQEAVDAAVSFAESIRKIPVKVKECPGFLVNRLLMPYLNEACYIVQEGQATAEEVDSAMVEFGMPMGPFMLVDNLGLDICHHVSVIMEDAYGNRAKAPQLIERLVSAKRLGKKSGAGFYVYDGASGDYSKFLGITKTGQCGEIVERLLYTMVNEAASCIDESIAAPSDIDLALIAGIGFPQAKQGLLRWADQVGLDVIFERLCYWRKTHGDRFVSSLYLRRLVDAGFTGLKSKKGFFDY